MQIARSIVLLFMLQTCLTQNLVFLSPSEFVETFRDNKIKVTSSPIGFKPKSGSLHGKIVLANPLNACIDVQQVQDIEGEQDVFMMADDLGCLQSVKAHNLASSGSYVGLIKRNINNTLNDRQVDIVHIPILQVEPDDYNRIYNYISKNPNEHISAVADFNPESERKKITMELWLSPLQESAYEYILSLQKFITKQPSLIEFNPRFVLHSQANRKQYIGCFSSGRFCPPQLQYEGKPEGAKIVGEALRQIIISNRDVSQWFKYANYYYQNCLRKAGENLWQQQNSQLCSESAMMSSDIPSSPIMTEFKASFKGSRPQVDSNIYLEQQRQLYIEQKITKYPSLIINGKQYFMQESPSELQLRICTMIHPNIKQQSKQCQTLANPPLFTTGEICIIVGVSIGLLVAIMIVCKKVIYVRMKKQMKGEVEKTLSQYYRYMDTFEEPDPSATGKVPLMEPKIDTNQIGSVQLSEIKNNS